MTRLVYSLFAAAFVVSFNACEQHSVAELPPHYQHKADHGSSHHGADEKHGAAEAKHGEAAKHGEEKHAPAVEKKH